MISAKSRARTASENRTLPAEFKYIKRGFGDVIVLIPGWATDYRIFSALDLGFDYLLPVNFSPRTFETSLIATLKENKISKVSLFGYSLGGFVGAEFASEHPDLTDELILVGIRKRYKRETLEEIKIHLGRSKKGYLYKFYSQCFPKKEDMVWFRNNLLKSYCEDFDLEYLFEGLDYFKNAEIKPGLLKDIKITIMHGERDLIAPIGEAAELKSVVPRARFVSLKEAGHMPFLIKDFKRFYDREADSKK